MFFTVKKNTLVYFTLIILIIIFSLILIFIGMSKSTSAEEEKPQRVIVIDAGHGGVDGGASSGDVLEKDLNLSVAQKLCEIINSTGNKAVMTREDDSVALPQNGKYSKKIDLEHRMSVIDDNNGDVFISIHMNKFTDPKYSGAQVFYSNNGEESKKLGETLQASLKNNLDNANSRVAKSNERNVYILKNAKIPAVLVECGFLSNPDELKNLTDDSYQKRLTEAINTGLNEYLLNTFKIDND